MKKNSHKLQHGKKNNYDDKDNFGGKYGPGLL